MPKMVAWKPSPTQRRLLHNIALKRNPRSDVNGMSAHGGFGQTVESLRRRDLIRNADFKNLDANVDPWVLTIEGADVHQKFCCHKGTTPEDLLTDAVEKRLGIEDKEPPWRGTDGARDILDATSRQGSLGVRALPDFHLRRGRQPCSLALPSRLLQEVEEAPQGR